jgi:Dyp-type peroxidase family
LPESHLAIIDHRDIVDRNFLVYGDAGGMTSAFRQYPEGVSSKPRGRASTATAPRPDDVMIDTDEIQGNVVGGFNKPFQTFLCLRIDDPRLFRWRLGELVPRIASATEVLAFNHLFRAMQQRRVSGGVSGHLSPVQPVKAAWVNIAFSYAGLRKLTDGTNLELRPSGDFKDQAFREGLAKRSKDLGDPTSGPGSPDAWIVGGAKREVDALIIVASDDRGDLGEEVISWRIRLERCATIVFPELPQRVSNPRTLFRDDGAVEVGAKLEAGTEHFGYRDGISQPGLRGISSANPRDVVTPRRNPSNRAQGLPGQDLLWPGEFVFGYPTQVPHGDPEYPGPLSSAGPDWTVNGSFLVFRRLNQDVYGFHSFLERASRDFNLPNAVRRDPTARANWLGARLIGRWASGAPVTHAPSHDVPAHGENELVNNDFQFQADPSGLICPFAAHIRKVYPRDDIPARSAKRRSEHDGGKRDLIDEVDAQKHRLLRRGIPFGRASGSTPARPQKDNAERGLYFLAYQTSIVDQFEFVIRGWASNPDFRQDRAGYDPLIGQNGSAADRTRHFSLAMGNGQTKVLEIPSEWVTPTGGEYFFSPSIAAIQRISRARSRARVVRG